MIRQIDKAYYEERIKPYLPKRVYDAHTHVWLAEHRGEMRFPMRGASWASGVENENSVERLMADWEQLWPNHAMEGLVFGWVDPDMDVEANNRYVAEKVKQYNNIRGLAVTLPTWEGDILEAQVARNGLIGLKPYITFADASIATDDITIFDMIPPSQFKWADNHAAVVMLHLPRPGRIADSANLEQLLRIEKEYPNVRLIVAHIGRAYHPGNLGDALEKLSQTKHMMFDFAGNTNAQVIESAIRTFGSDRIMFGSDLPLTHIHLSRVYTDTYYVNLVDPGERPAIVGAAHMQAAPDAGKLTLFLYEQVEAFLCAAKRLRLSASQMEDVFYSNAKRFIG